MPNWTLSIPGRHFDTVVAGEIIEHFLYDPMHMLLESHRILAEGGFLLITTPNVGSITSVAKTLSGPTIPRSTHPIKRGGPESRGKSVICASIR